MIIEIWGGPRDGEMIEVNDDARYFHLVRPLDRQELLWKSVTEPYPTTPDYAFDTLTIRQYMGRDGLIEYKAVWPGYTPK